MTTRGSAYGVHMDKEQSELSGGLRPARRFTDEPDPEGWSAKDVPDSERVDDRFIDLEAADPATPTKAYPPLAPEDDRLFPPIGWGEA